MSINPIPITPPPAASFVSVYPSQIHMSNAVAITGKAAKGCDGLSIAIKDSQGNSISYQTLCIKGVFVIMFVAPDYALKSYTITVTVTQTGCADSVKSLTVYK